jgi:molybdopterin-guanine dinucleotide biosynthesis protein A
LGRNKALEIINNEVLINRVIDRVSVICHKLLVITSSENFPYLDFIDRKIKIIKDIYPGKAALGAIYTGLSNMSTEYGLIVACDMPFLNSNLLRFMVDISPGYEIVVPKIDGFTEPLHAVYKKTCAGYTEKLLQKDVLLIRKLYEAAVTRFISNDEINKYDPDHLSLFNINTRADLEFANKLAVSLDKR